MNGNEKGGRLVHLKDGREHRRKGSKVDGGTLLKMCENQCWHLATSAYYS